MLIVNALLVASALLLLSGSGILRAKILIPAAIAFTVLVAALGMEKIHLISIRAIFSIIKNPDTAELKFLRITARTPFSLTDGPCFQTVT